MPTENMKTPPAPFVLVGDSIKNSINRIIPRHRPSMFKAAIEELEHVANAVRAQMDTSLRTTNNLQIGNKWWGSEQFLVEYITALGATVSPEVIDLIDAARPNTHKLPKWAEEPRLLQTQVERIAAWENFFRLNEKMRVDESWQIWCQNYSRLCGHTFDNSSIIESLACHEWGISIDKVDRAGIVSLIRMSNRWGQSLAAFFSRNHYIPGGDGSYHDTAVHPKRLRTVPYQKFAARFPTTLRTTRRTSRESRETVARRYSIPISPPVQAIDDSPVWSIIGEDAE